MRSNLEPRSARRKRATTMLRQQPWAIGSAMEKKHKRREGDVSTQLLPPRSTVPVDGWYQSATVPGTMGLHHADLFNGKKKPQAQGVATSSLVSCIWADFVHSSKNKSTAVTTAIPIGCVLACRSHCWMPHPVWEQQPRHLVVLSLSALHAPPGLQCVRSLRCFLMGTCSALHGFTNITKREEYQKQNTHTRNTRKAHALQGTHYTT